MPDSPASLEVAKLSYKCAAGIQMYSIKLCVTDRKPNNTLPLRKSEYLRFKISQNQENKIQVSSV